LSQQEPSTQQPDLETRVLADFLYELNISRRHLSTYPPGHPMIESSTDQVLAKLDRLFESRDRITLGVAKEALLFDQEWLDKKNPVFRDFASALARLGIAAISFHRKPNRDELIQVNRIFCSDRQSIGENGGFAAMLEQRQVNNIEITEVDYSSFRATEEDQLAGEDLSTTLWEEFISGLLSGTQGGDGGPQAGSQLDPLIVAEILNRNIGQPGRDSSRNFEQVIASFTTKMQRSGHHMSRVHSQFTELISNLTQELRREFLASVFSSLDPANPSTEALLGKLSTEDILTALDDLNRNRLQISRTMVNLLGKLAEHRQAGGQSLTSGKSVDIENQHREHVNTIFREEERGKFTPEAYQQALDRIVAFDESDFLLREETSQLRQQLNYSSIERHCCALFLKLLRPELAAEQAEGIESNLIDLAHYFLEVGDFKGLRFLHSGVLNYRKQYPQGAPEQTDRLLATLTDPQFQREVLDSLKRWGEEKQQEIRVYIRATGSLFAESLVHHLATEESMGLRRLYVNTLISLGKAAHQAIYANLTDRRWYLVRNLLSVLRMQSDPIELDAIYRLENHPHPRVNHELLTLLFKYDRPRADNLLLKQLSSKDQALQLHAVQLAELSRSPMIVDKLLSMLGRDKVTKHNLPLKLSIVKSLGQVGAENALPQLERLLFSGWLFIPAPLKQLKLEIARSLDNYPAGKLQPLLAKLAKSRQKELGRIAGEKLRQLAGIHHGQ